MINKDAVKALMEKIENDFLKNRVLYHTLESQKELQPIE